jgi:vacuolar-type H+-ATPase subunit H
MKQIIEEVLQAEAKVKSSLDEARQQASRIKSAAEKEAAEQLNEAREQAREIVQNGVEQAKGEAEQLRKDKLAEADAASESLLNSHAEAMDALVQEISQVILSTKGTQA